jgi:hypothetical protein
MATEFGSALGSFNSFSGVLMHNFNAFFLFFSNHIRISLVLNKKNKNRYKLYACSTKKKHKNKNQKTLVSV